MANQKTKTFQRFEAFQQLSKGIFEKYTNIDTQLLKKQPTPSEWSILQVLEHLLESEQVSFGYLKKKTKDYSTVKKTNLSTSLRSFLLRMSLKSSLKFKAPPVLTAPKNESEIADLLSKIEQGRKEIKDLMSNLPPDAFELELFRHPVAGRLNLYQMFGFMMDHWNHHERQMENLLKKAA